jgi:hypothetical protein
VVVVARRPGTSEVVSLYSCVVDVRDVVVANFVSVLKEDVHAIVVFDELAHSQGEGIGLSFIVVDPVICHINDGT